MADSIEQLWHDKTKDSTASKEELITRMGIEMALYSCDSTIEQLKKQNEEWNASQK